MEKIKKVFFLSAILVALVMTSCSGKKYMNYIPAGSKAVGKIDFKAFFEQTGVDKDKFFSDIKDNFGDELGSVEEIGVDLSEPVYIFGDGGGNNVNYGIVAKVDDRDKVKEWCDDKLDMKVIKGDGFDYAVKNQIAIGVNKEALVILTAYGSSGDAKKAIKNIMSKKNKDEIKDNKLFKRVNDSKSFACLYGDMSLIINDDFVEQAGSMIGSLKGVAEDINKMTVGLDVTFKDGICDFEYWAESDDKDVQDKINEMKKVMSTPVDKAINTLPSNAVAGMATNVDGEKLAGYLRPFVEDDELTTMLPPEFLNIANECLELMAHIHGDMAGYFVAPLSVMFSVQSDKDMTGDIAQLVMKSMTAGSDYFAAVADDEDISYQAASLDVTNDSLADEELSPSLGSRYSSLIKETANGYCINNNFWLGYNNGAIYTTNDENLISGACSPADNPISSNLSSLMKQRRFVFFFNMGLASGYTSLVDDDDVKKLINAFSRVIEKTQFVTFSMK